MLTGHLIGEDSIEGQLCGSNGVMPAYEYFHEPGVDWLGRKIDSPCLPKQLGSVARQLGKKTLTESFALCGWDVSLNELKWIAQWQYLNGVTSLCPHLEGYSIRGERKRDYPASLYSQLPWFERAYSDFADYFTSLGALLDSGEDIAPLLVIHPIHSAFVLHNFNRTCAMVDYSKKFNEFAEVLNAEKLFHHYGDEVIMKNHGCVKGDIISIGKCDYKTILLPDVLNLTHSTVSLLTQFAENGGKIYAIGRMPSLEEGRTSERLNKLNEYIEPIASLAELKVKEPQLSPVKITVEGENAPNLHTALKKLNNGDILLYIINNEKEVRTAQIQVNGEYTPYLIDLLTETEEILEISPTKEKTEFSFCFAEYGSAVIVLKERQNIRPSKIETEYIKLSNNFEIVASSENALTLDKCTYRINGGEWQSELAVILLQRKALELRKACDVEMQFEFNIDGDFDFRTVKLCMEEPKKYSIKINNQDFNFADGGEFVDRSIRKANIGKYLKKGVNTIYLCCRFTQSDELYYAKFTPGIHESVLNKLTYDTEFESLYIIGDFGVYMAEDYTLGERKCLHAGKTFSLVAPKKYVNISDITRQNFWFFRGEMELVQTVSIEKKENVAYKIVFTKLNAPAAKVYVNGKPTGIMAFSPFELDVTELLNHGENEIKIMLLSGNRNLLGPHHKPIGETYSVGPSTFTDTAGWTDNSDEPQWTDNYNFVLFGVEL